MLIKKSCAEKSKTPSPSYNELKAGQVFRHSHQINTYIKLTSGDYTRLDDGQWYGGHDLPNIKILDKAYLVTGEE